MWRSHFQCEWDTHEWLWHYIILWYIRIMTLNMWLWAALSYSLIICLIVYVVSLVLLICINLDSLFMRELKWGNGSDTFPSHPSFKNRAHTHNVPIQTCNPEASGFSSLKISLTFLLFCYLACLPFMHLQIPQKSQIPLYTTVWEQRSTISHVSIAKV